MTVFQKIFKRVFDLLLSLAALLIFFPFGLLISLLIKIDSPGPVFFTQLRVGKDSQDFLIYKFRTMVVNAEKKGAGLEIEKGDSRITRMGKFLRISSLDEFPQFINILKGEMSFIGPRPTVRSQVKKYDKEQLRRLNVKPGITGLAQVSGRNSLSWPERIEKDLEYIDNYSVFLDIRIFFKTFLVVLFPKDVYGEEGTKDFK